MLCDSWKTREGGRDEAQDKGDLCIEGVMSDTPNDRPVVIKPPGALVGLRNRLFALAHPGEALELPPEEPPEAPAPYVEPPPLSSFVKLRQCPLLCRGACQKAKPSKEGNWGNWIKYALPRAGECAMSREIAEGVEP